MSDNLKKYSNLVTSFSSHHYMFMFISAISSSSSSSSSSWCSGRLLAGSASNRWLKLLPCLWPLELRLSSCFTFFYSFVSRAMMCLKQLIPLILSTSSSCDTPYSNEAMTTVVKNSLQLQVPTVSLRNR